MARMRTIDQAAQYIHERDAETALTKTALRRLVISGALKHVRIGSKYLVDLDVLESFLAAGSSTVTAPGNQSLIRRLEAR